MSLFLTIFIILFLISNIIIIFYEHKNKKNMFLWLFFNLFFPFGFIFYCLLQNKLQFISKTQIVKISNDTIYFLNKTSWYKNYNKDEKILKTKNNLNKFVYKNFKIFNYPDNKINIFLDGESFFYDLCNNINHCKKSILLEFYIFEDDKYGKILKDLLIKKLKQNVKVIVLYDSIGSKKTNKNFWNELVFYGAIVSSFFPTNLKNIIGLKINFRNHRKIVVIDGHISYIGGVNIRHDHMSKVKKLSPWRDTHLKIVGKACYELTKIFFNDFNFSYNTNIICQNKYQNEYDIYFPKINSCGDVNVCILNSSPANNKSSIYLTYLKAIKQSTQFIYIQTPYFIVKNEIIRELINASKRGVKVCIMIPEKTDKKIIYASTIDCIKNLLNTNIKIYLYKGFLHSKTFCTDQVSSIGTCNFDYRSFNLNFESTCLFFDKQFIIKNKKIFNDDIKNCKELDLKIYKKIKAKNILFLTLIKIFNKFF